MIQVSLLSDFLSPRKGQSFGKKATVANAGVLEVINEGLFFMTSLSDYLLLYLFSSWISLMNFFFFDDDSISLLVTQLQQNKSKTEYRNFTESLKHCDRGRIMGHDFGVDCWLQQSLLQHLNLSKLNPSYLKALK